MSEKVPCRRSGVYKGQSGKVSARGVQGLGRRSVWLVGSEHEGEWRRVGQGDR